MTVITYMQAVGMALVVGYDLQSAYVIAAIAEAESGLDSNAVNVNADKSKDRGILQINDKWHPEVSDTQAFDIQGAFDASFKISQQGTDFTPWETYKSGAYLQFLPKSGGGSGVILLNSRGEVCDLATISQFYPNKTEFACGFYAAALLRYAGYPNHGASGGVSAIEAWAESEYRGQYGSVDLSQIGGVTIADMHRLLVKAMEELGGHSNSHYQDLNISESSGQGNDIGEISAALASRYPVACTVTEVSIYDQDLGRNPYFWGASGTHVVVITGETPDSWLVHDTANVTGTLNGANSIRPQPRRYKKSVFAAQWASMVRLPWLQAFPQNWNWRVQVLNK